ncbi:protein suppressor 2 of zeste-like [Trichogramma pretiosum]|uniref:protein suppressor 2 of zeste-like n=1 Tax=Trichogramma pretiosum TaxID=7493 RepID=UPI0006C9642D|nr:protein suppressor 2 of zeste-like [Trichogramma pretiosum]
MNNNQSGAKVSSKEKRVATKMPRRPKPSVKELNEHIVCSLCRGYLIDATTLVECLHSFCRGCIVRRLQAGPKNCPVCCASASQDPLVHDVALQRLVYLVVPGLYKSEIERRRHFRQVNPQCTNLTRQPVGAPELTFDDLVSLSLSEWKPGGGGAAAIGINDDDDDDGPAPTRYLKCPAGVSVKHLVRLLMLKRGWDHQAQDPTRRRIDIMYEVKASGGSGKKTELEVLDPAWTLLDLACIFDWKRQAPMKLLYRINSVEDSTLVNSKIQSSNSVHNDSTASNHHHHHQQQQHQSMENIQRPPTPPPSPKPALSPGKTSSSRPTTTTTTIGSDHHHHHHHHHNQTKELLETRKPRCEVTPVMRSPDYVTSANNNNNNNNNNINPDRQRKANKLAKLEHQHKRKKRKNKRVIAEITTTPREDLLKLKVRLTPCPPRITSNTVSSSSSSSTSSVATQSKEKLIQMRAVRKEKTKEPSLKIHIPKIDEVHNAMLEEKKSAAAAAAVAAKMEEMKRSSSSSEEKPLKISMKLGDPANKEKVELIKIKRKEERIAAAVEQQQQHQQQLQQQQQHHQQQQQREETPKNEEVLRKLGLVAIAEANRNKHDSAQEPQQKRKSDESAHDAAAREKLEKKYRFGKANRVRSLLAEKQMRDAEKCMSSSVSKSSSSSPQFRTTTPTQTQTTTKRKEPPPLTPLRNAKRANVTFAPASSFIGGRNESPLDLSSPTSNFGGGGGSMIKDNSVLDLSESKASRSPAEKPAGILRNSNNPSKPSPPPQAVASQQLQQQITLDNKSREDKKNQEANLQTLSNAAASLMGVVTSQQQTSPPPPLSKLPPTYMSSPIGNGPVSQQQQPTSNLHNRVDLRIPQPQQRLASFSMKMKPSMGVRHIPNPQAVVASQYRNQRAGFFGLAHQPP